MRWLKGDLRKSDVIIIGVMLLLTLLIVILVLIEWGHQTAQPGQVTGTIAIETAKEQLLKLQRDNERSFNAWFWNNGVAIISSLALVLGGLVAVFKYFSDRQAERERREKEEDRWLEDRRAEREKRDEEQRRWLKDQETEREKRAEERFQAAVEGLSSQREEAKIGAAILLRTFLRSGYNQFYQQVFDLAVANLRLPRISTPSEHQDTPFPLTTLSQALIIVFKEALPLARRQASDSHSRFVIGIPTLDATGIQLDNAYLREADLKQVRMPEASLRKANLKGATLSGADLYNAKLCEASLTGADLSNASLIRTNLFNAWFRQANLTEAELTEADVTGANFNKANLSRAKLYRVKLEEAYSLRDANLHGVIGLTKEQLDTCKAKGALIDEDITTSSSQSAASPSRPSQSNDQQASSAPPAKVDATTPNTDVSSTTSSEPSDGTSAPSTPSVQGSTPASDTDESSATSSQ